MVTVAGLTPTLATYRAGLEALQEGGEEGERWSKILQLYEAMLAANVRPDGKIVEAVVRALGGAGRLERGLAVVEEAKAWGVPASKGMYRALLAPLLRKTGGREGLGAASRGAREGGKEGREEGKGRGGTSGVYRGAGSYAAGLDLLYGVDPRTGRPKHRMDDAAAVVLVEEVFRWQGGRVSWTGVAPVVSLVLRDIKAESSGPAHGEGEGRGGLREFSESTFLLVLSLCKAAEEGAGREGGQGRWEGGTEGGREGGREGGALEAALLVLAGMVERGHGNVLAFNMVLKMCERRGDARRALLLLAEMRSLPALLPDLITYNTLISACAKGHRPRDAQRLVKELEGEGGRIVPSLVTYNSLLAALAQAGQWKEAMRVLQTLQRKNLRPDVITYTSLIQACSKARPSQVKKALYYLELMKEAREGGGEVTPDAVAYAAAIEACARGGPNAGWGETALRLFEEMQERGMEAPAQVYRALVQACGNDVVPEGRAPTPSGPPAASDTSAAMRASTPPVPRRPMTTARVWSLLQACPPAHRNNFVYTAAAKACERGRDWGMALRLVEDMRRLGIEPDDITHGQLLHVLASMGRWEEALGVLASIRRRNVRHYTSAIRACGLAGGAAAREGMPLYVRMREEGLVPDLYVYNVVLQALRAADCDLPGNGRPLSSPSSPSSSPSSSTSVADDALALYEEMRGNSPAKYAAGTLSMGKNNRRGQQLPRSLPPPSPVTPDIVSFTVLISILERHGRHAQALRVFQDGVRAQVLMTTPLDTLWEKDLSRLSFQLVRAAVDFSVGELVADFRHQLKAAAGTKDPDVQDLVLITGSDVRGARGAGGGPRQDGMGKEGMGAAHGQVPETRQALARLVLSEKGLLPADEESRKPGVLTVPADVMRQWLCKQ
ncbi:hypothetical protein NSK_007998 [Nannochloropsis salina CCMP1776]|nr:hypothetical protein NSK_007998 [Nannochloropsis salina CCMP1776]|eukprot:TFJ80571.1 hypothetical protein NSK_007998 [Nannochloropsis salina CCMP1776]